MAATTFNPFTATYKVVPARAYGRRFEYIRDLQRLAWLAQNALSTLPNLRLAQPGGGQARNHSRPDNLSSDYVDALAVKPQFGNSPAQFTIEGFYLVTGQPVPPYPTFTRIAQGATWTGLGGYQPWSFGTGVAVADPTPATVAEVQTLRALLDSTLSANMPSTVLVADSKTPFTNLIPPTPGGSVMKIFRLEYKGSRWGARGFTFPH